MKPGMWRRRGLVWGAVVVWGMVQAGLTGWATAATIEDACEAPETSWQVSEAAGGHRVFSHTRTRELPHRGMGCERFQLESMAATALRLQTPIGPTQVIEEWRASVWVRASRPDIRLCARVILPHFVSPKTGQPVVTLVPGTTSRQQERWEQLQVSGLVVGLQRQLLALRAEHGPVGDLAGAQVIALVLELPPATERQEIAIDDLLVEGVVGAVSAGVANAPAARPPPPVSTPGVPPIRPAKRDPAVQPAQFAPPVRQAAVVASAAAANPPAADLPAGLSRGVLEVGGLPFFPRAIDHNGEPLEAIAALGFNCVRLATPASSDLLLESRRAGLWVICPPPQLPDVDIREPESLPVFSATWDRVLLWDMGSGLAEADVETLAEHARRVRTCDVRGRRPLIAAADSGLRSLSRHVDLLVARRTVLGTSMELVDYLSWLKERPRLARPGTPFLATLSTELDPRTARQAAGLSGIGSRGLAVDPESLTLAAFTAVAAGSRGILFSSSHRIDGDDHESRARAAAARGMNLRLKPLEPWGAAGRFAATAQASDPDVQAVVLEAARARMVLVWRSVQGAQIVARHYNGDIPQDSAPITLLMPGVPEAHQAWEVTPGGLRPLRPKRVTGGVSVVLDPFRSASLVLISGDPAVAAHVQEQLRATAPASLASALAQARIVLADATDMLTRISPTALGKLPAAAMLAAAQSDLLEGESLAGAHPAAATAKLERAAAIGGQLERLVWERGVVATGSMVAGPLSTSDASLAEHWRFVEALAFTTAGQELLPGGGMERIEELSGNGWRHFALKQALLRTGVEISRSQPAAGTGSLVLRAEAVDPAASPAVVETPPVWITTPPMAVPSGKLLQIEARVWVPQAVKGSSEGLLVFDSLGGPALAERVGVTPGWRRLVLYRIVPAEATGEPLIVTFALTGLGEARVDAVSIRVLERGIAGPPADAVTALPSADPAAPFPQPGELLGSPAPALPLPPVAGTAVAGGPEVGEPPEATLSSTTPQWPGMNLEWPKLLPFGQSSSAPPPGPGGGRIDPFKRVQPAPGPAATP